MDYYLFSIWDLFYRLREEGMPLGTEEYFDALKALKSPMAERQKDDLSFVKWILEAIWVKSPDEKPIFDHHFDLSIRQFDELTADWQPRVDPETKVELPDSSDPSLPDSDPEHETVIRNEDGSIKIPIQQVSLAEKAIQQQKQMTSAKVIASLPNRFTIPPKVRQQFEFSENYLPVGQRDMQQAWRFLRRLSPSGPPINIDVRATVEQVCSEGLLIEPVLKPRLTNQADVILLIDRKGSMVPFHILEDMFIESATEGSLDRDHSIFYFHDVPRDKVFFDKSLQKPFWINQLYDRMDQRHSLIVIFSDAGSGRGMPANQKRLIETSSFIEEIHRRANRLVWINPMPFKRWANTSAEYLSKIAPMVPFSKAGITKAVNVLRGKSDQTSVELNRE